MTHFPTFFPVLKNDKIQNSPCPVGMLFDLLELLFLCSQMSGGMVGGYGVKKEFLMCGDHLET